MDGLKQSLSGQLIELERVKSLTEEEKKRLESSLQDRDNEISDLKEKLSLYDEKREELKLMKDEIVQKDAEIKNLKARLNGKTSQSYEKDDSKSDNNSSSTDNILLDKGQEVNSGINSMNQDSSAVEERDLKERERVSAD